jgi:hypothetical protein
MNTALKVATLCALATLAACSRTVTHEVVREQPIIQPQAAAPERVVVVQPPAAPVETRPAPPAPTGYSWVGGYYEWRNNQWEWTPGHWVLGSVSPMPPAQQESPGVAPRAGARWIPGHWAFSGNDWVWMRGQWL